MDESKTKDCPECMKYWHPTCVNTIFAHEEMCEMCATEQDWDKETEKEGN